MDFGGLSFDGLMGSDTNTANITTASGSGFDSLVSSDPETKQKWYGSGFLKQGRSGTNEDDWRSSKLCKTESMLLQQKMSTTSLPPPSSLSFFTRTDKGQKEPHMLSFSCPNSESFSVDRSFQNSSFPFLHLSSSAYNDGNTVYSSGSFNGGSMQLGAFTQSQWMELEHQALIYKYITANVPIPSNLLSPIRQAVESAARLSCFPASLLRPNTLAWGPFHLGYPGNTDPEPGRCRRTDGKKWRCSRDAVADQKYCERHMNRGRHRSRKPVEGQSGHSTAASATTANNAKLATSASAATMVVGTQGGSVSNSLPLQQQLQLKNFQTAGSNTSLSRTFLEKDNLVTANSLHSTSNKSSSLMNGRNFGCAEGLTGPLCQFMDDWPNKSQSDCSVVSWPQLDLQSDRPQLSISIPMTTADYMSSTSSPNNETTTLSPLRLSHEFDPIQMGLGVGSGLNEPNQRQANWIPISWGTSMGGPLGEVLNNTSNNSSGECKNSSALNLMTEGWESSPRMESSPTGVLQKSTFRSLSNSSAGSSPRADNNKTTESASLCNALGSALVQQSAVPAL